MMAPPKILRSNVAAKAYFVGMGRPQDLGGYVAGPQVTRSARFELFDGSIAPNNTMVVFPCSDLYVMGVVQSHAHWIWRIVHSADMGGVFRYDVFAYHTFGWPQSSTNEQVDSIAKAAKNLVEVRCVLMEEHRCELVDLHVMRICPPALKSPEPPRRCGHGRIR
jgi:hypothetical protein